MQYDRADRVVRRSDASVLNAIVDTLTYDSRGKRARVQGNPLLGEAAQVLTAGYDSFGQLVASSYLAGEPIVDLYELDALGNRLAHARNRWNTTFNSVSKVGVDSSAFTGHQLTRQLGTPRPYNLSGPGGGTSPFQTRLDSIGFGYDPQGNLLERRLVKRVYKAATWGRDSTDHEFSWHVYDADQRLRWSQRTTLREVVAGGQPPYPQHTQEEYWYDALGRRVLTRTRVDSTGCGALQRYDPAPCVQQVHRPTWDGVQLLREWRRRGGWQLADAVLDDTMPTDSLYKAVWYAIGPAIDEPLLLWLHDTDRLLIHRNARGFMAGATRLTGPAEVPGGRFPAAALNSFHAPDSRFPALTTSFWYGTLATDQRDATGLSYRRHRYYDGASGRFTQPDPIGLAGGLNLYGYADGDPVNFSDPFGLCTQEKWWTCKILSFTGGVRFGLGIEGNVLGAKVKLNSANAGASGTMSMGTDGISGAADARVSLGGVDINLGPVLKFNRDFGTCSTSSGCEESVSASAGAGGVAVSDHGDISAGATLGVVKVGVKLHAANLVTATVGIARWLFRIASDQVQVGNEPED